MAGAGGRTNIVVFEGDDVPAPEKVQRAVDKFYAVVKEDMLSVTEVLQCLLSITYALSCNVGTSKKLISRMLVELANKIDGVS